MQEIRKHGHMGRAARAADMSPKTARKYVMQGKLPSETKPTTRAWRTRANPFARDWPWVEEALGDAPEFEAKTLFEALQLRDPDRYQDGMLRTFQRHVKQWRATKGPEREVFFQQAHRPGEALQTDWTDARKLQVTIQGVLFMHLLCNVVLPYSNWQWVTVCLSESFLSLKRGLQEALFRLQRRPEWHQTDNSSSATHNVAAGKKREFNDNYVALMDAVGLKPRTIGIGKKEQNGDVEASNGALKRWLIQRLLIRGSRDFESVEAYEQWLWAQLLQRNRQRVKRCNEELSVMGALCCERLPEFRTCDATVTSFSTIRVEHNTYSVPSRLRGESVRVRVFERHIEVFYAQKLQFSMERLLGRFGHRINYRHIISSLVRKPGAFARFRYRSDMFPTVTFREAYDAIYADKPSVEGDLAYLRILKLAAETMEADVLLALECLIEAGEIPCVDAVRALVAPCDNRNLVESLQLEEVALTSYDVLLDGKLEVAS